MELVYVSEWPKTDANLCTKKLIGDTACSWSCRNILAFSTLNNSKGLAERELYRPKIHVVDPDRPWELHSISGVHKDLIQVLQWNASGTRLLSGDSSGTSVLWQMKDHLLNDWESVAESHVNGEPIVALGWLHNGVKISYNVDNIDSPSMLDKFTRSRFTPSLLQVGTKPAVGWIAVTSTGLVSVTILKSGGGTSTFTECLGKTRCHAELADIAYSSSGDILIATSDGSCRSPVQVYKVNLSWRDDKVFIETDYLPSLHVQCCVDLNNKDKYLTITHLRFINKECYEEESTSVPAEQLIISAIGSSGSCVEFWSLSKEFVPLNKIFQTSPPPSRESQPTTQKWVFGTCYTNSSAVTGLCLPKLPVKLSSKSIYNGPGMVMAVAFQDGSVKLLHRVSLKPCASFKYEGAKVDTGSQAKRQKVYNGKHLMCMEMSSTCCSIMAVDRMGALCLIKIAPTLGQALDQGAARAHTIAQVVNLLEYSLVTGYEWWDLLHTITPGMVDTVIDRLTEAFNRQSKSTQELLFSRLVAVKASLHRMTSSGAGKSVDCYCKLLLNAISSEFRSLLRPTSVTAQDKGPAEKLTAICAHSTELDLTKLMLNIDTKDYALDPNSIQSLQQLVQWIAEYCLYTLSTVPQQASNPTKPGISVLRDTSTLCLLREMLVLIKIWGIRKKTCLPVFSTTSDSLDTLSHLYKLMTHVWLASKEIPPAELDENTVDECCLLPSQIMMHPLDVTPVTEGITGKLLLLRQAMSFQFNTTPPHMVNIATFGHSLNIFPGSEVNVRSLSDKIHQKTDVVRRLYLGVAPPDEIRSCTRCSSISMLNSPTRTVIMKAWEQRWARSCLCGGLWRRVVMA
ncbi:mediator of RNA polymerase II transcription subunit 16-like [Asterias amurensis]|uniref:mediator of RNA polymerase II transcription subunit 16-like n=1 Tax=Asterias amurensis TaxID=7602 RepID=UPI003AB5B388